MAVYDGVLKASRKTAPTEAKSMPTNIEWTDETWNPVTGCTKVSAGCKNCYAERDWARLASNPKVPAYYGRRFQDVQTHSDRLGLPLRWNKPRRVFVNSMSDLFHEDVHDSFIDRVMGAMWLCAFLGKGHAFQVLTKRAERMRSYFDVDHTVAWTDHAVHLAFEAGLRSRWPKPDELTQLLHNFITEHRGVNPALWLGVSVEHQDAADQRIGDLLHVRAAIRFLSMEPLLGPVTIARWLRPWTCSDCQYHGHMGESGPSRCDACDEATHYDADSGSDKCPACGRIDAEADDIGMTCPRCGHAQSWSEDAGFHFPSDGDREDQSLIDWVIAGGESGPAARPTDPAWVRALRDECREAGAAFFFKQWGEWAPCAVVADDRFAGGVAVEHPKGGRAALHVRDGGGKIRPLLAGERTVGCTRFDEPSAAVRVGRAVAGRLLDGVEHNDYPSTRKGKPHV